jgi:alkaline phosphatase
VALSSTALAAPSVAKRNVIFMVSDGTGPATHTATRQFLNITQGTGSPIDSILVGMSSTSSFSNLITDSAAGATAFSCGHKTNNHYVATTPNGKPCGTLLEAAKAIGMKTGLVVTSMITDATPAAFASHVVSRVDEPEIAAQLMGGTKLGRTVDLMFGGGAKFFLPKDKGGVREDGRDLFAESKKNGWHHVQDMQAFTKLDARSPLPLFGLFAEEDLPYSVDRDPTKDPALSDMTRKSLEILKQATQNSDKGFFILVEGSNIDNAAHLNDPVAHIGDAVEYYKTIQVVKDFVKNNPDTIMISVSDHETGGLVLGKTVMEKGERTFPDWKPQVIKRAKMSTTAAARKVIAFKGDAAARKQFIEKDILAQGFGIDHVDPKDVQTAIAAIGDKNPELLTEAFSAIVSKAANLAWTSFDHSAVDVPLYAMGPGTDKLRGHHIHTDLNKFVVDYLGLDLAAITLKLQ